MVPKLLVRNQASRGNKTVKLSRTGSTKSLFVQPHPHHTSPSTCITLRLPGSESIMLSHAILGTVLRLNIIPELLGNPNELTESLGQHEIHINIQR